MSVSEKEIPLFTTRPPGRKQNWFPLQNPTRLRGKDNENGLLGLAGGLRKFAYAWTRPVHSSSSASADPSHEFVSSENSNLTSGDHGSDREAAECIDRVTSEAPTKDTKQLKKTIGNLVLGITRGVEANGESSLSNLGKNHPLPVMPPQIAFQISAVQEVEVCAPGVPSTSAQPISRNQTERRRKRPRPTMLQPQPQPCSGVAHRALKRSDMVTHHNSGRHLAIFYKWLQVKIETEGSQSACSFIHRALSKGYTKVESIALVALEEEDNGNSLYDLLMRRQHLAGLWCIYAQIMMDFWLQRKQEFTSRECSKRTRRKRTSLVQNKNLWHNPNSLKEPAIYHLILSILVTARECPLVGNHPLVCLSLARFIQTWAALQHSNGTRDVHVPKGELAAALRSAMDSCWDAINTFQGKDLLKNSQSHANKYRQDLAQMGRTQIGAYIDSDEGLRPPNGCSVQSHVAMKSVLALPESLRDAFGEDGLMVSDKNTMRALCAELNRMSRLKERIETGQGMFLSSAEGCTLLDELPLFFAYNDATRQLPLDSMCLDVEFSAPMEKEENIIWWWDRRC